VKRLLPLFVSAALFFAGCPLFENPVPDSDEKVTRRERDVSGKIAVALGGMAEGADEIVIDEELRLLDFRNEDPDLFTLFPRDGFATFSTGNGARVSPRNVGIGYATPVVSGRTIDPIEVTIPPQKLIQILIGEARGELDREATLERGAVKSSSVSVTGDAVGATIRNRIDLINETGQAGLFVVDPEAYEADPPLSYYEAVIEANDRFVYQFSPVDPDDPSNEVYQGAEAREDLDGSLWIAYDQAVLTSAAVFNGDTADPTGGAFAFYSPTASESRALREALEDGALELPEGAGTSDSNFPALAPIQVLILDEVAPSIADDEVPSFVFVRSRDASEPAVTDVP
jgi:hypothetical protein